MKSQIVFTPLPIQNWKKNIPKNWLLHRKISHFDYKSICTDICPLRYKGVSDLETCMDYFEHPERSCENL